MIVRTLRNRRQPLSGRTGGGRLRASPEGPTRASAYGAVSSTGGVVSFPFVAGCSVAVGAVASSTLASGSSSTVRSTSIVQSVTSAATAPTAASIGASTAPITPNVSGNSTT